eukprot:366334-Chlamydomonas_euryale.AAC.10
MSRTRLRWTALRASTALRLRRSLSARRGSTASAAPSTRRRATTSRCSIATHTQRSLSSVAAAHSVTAAQSVAAAHSVAAAQSVAAAHSVAAAQREAAAHSAAAARWRSLSSHGRITVCPPTWHCCCNSADMRVRALRCPQLLTTRPPSALTYVYVSVCSSIQFCEPAQTFPWTRALPKHTLQSQRPTCQRNHIHSSSHASFI